MERPIRESARAARRSASAVLSMIALLSIVPSCAAPPGASRAETEGLAAAWPAAALVHPEDAGQLVEYPWGWIRWLMSADIEADAEMTFGVVQIDAGQLNPLHIHSNCEEYLYVISGSCEHRLGDRWATLKPGDTLRIPKGAVHMARTKDQPCRVMVVYDTGTRQMVPVTEAEKKDPPPER